MLLALRKKFICLTVLHTVFVLFASQLTAALSFSMRTSSFMLVYSIYCIVVSSLLFSPSIDNLCTCNMSSAPPASISLQVICGWESNAISYISNFQ